MRKQKKQIIAMLLMIMVLLCGCGNKSKAKITDIEQFRCQDSIQTVFDVLGEIKMETSAYIGENYTYENLNLYGYDGKAIFRVRDDKETISSFECNLILNKKEFEDVLSQLKDKYGEYEKNEYTNQTAYVWEIAEDKAEEIGYNRISLSDNGDKKVYVKFSDEWSDKKDDAYYKHLEEEKQKKNQTNILAQKTYSIGEDTFTFSLGEKEDEYNFNLICEIEDKSDAYITHISLNSLFNSDDENIKALTETMNFSYTIYVGDGTILLRTKGLLYITKDDEIIDVNDYFSIDWITSEEFRESDYGTQVANFLANFIENE